MAEPTAKLRRLFRERLVAENEMVMYADSTNEVMRQRKHDHCLKLRAEYLDELEKLDNLILGKTRNPRRRTWVQKLERQRRLGI